MKNNLSYYRHEVDSHNHWKFKTLRRKYKWCGEGKFWALNNIIADSEGCRLHFGDPDIKSSVAADLDFDLKDFEEFVQYLIKPCRLVKLENGYLTTGITQENLLEVNEKRERQREWKKEKSTAKTAKSTSTLSESTTKSEKSTVENEQSKVKESKVKESKEESTESAPVVSGGFRQLPTIPAKEKVLEVFLRQGGTDEMAQKFFDKYEATGWYLNGSAIVNFVSLVPNFIDNWRKNESKTNSPPENDYDRKRREAIEKHKRQNAQS